MFQNLEFFLLQQIPNKQWQIIVFKGFVQGKREKTCTPKQQGRGNPTSCPKQTQGLSSLNALKDGKAMSSVGFRVWPPSEWTLFSSHWVGLAYGSRLCLLPLFHHRVLGVLLCFGTSPAGGISRSIKIMTGLESNTSWFHALSESLKEYSYNPFTSLCSPENRVI